MKKLLLSMVAVLMMACATPTVNQTELYGVVEDVTLYNGHFHTKVWCEKKGMYINVITDKVYVIGQTIRIK